MMFLAGLGVPARASTPDPAPAKGTFGISLLDVPTSRRSDPRALTEIVDHLPPGAVIKRRVLLVSDLRDRTPIEVYVGAAAVGQGRFRIGEGHAADELTSWITLDRAVVDMDPGDKEPVEVTIRVPTGASTGERYAMVWASLSTKGDGGQIDVVNRVGVRIYLHVGPDAEPHSQFTVDTAVPTRDEHGKPTVTLGVNNTGGRALDISGTVNLSDGPDGARAGPYAVSTTTLAPGEAGTVTAQLPGTLAGGPWHLEADLTSGTVKQRATGTIAFADTGRPAKASALSRAGISRTAIGMSLVVGLVTLTGLGLIVRRFRG
ncbi:peptidase [Frankia sp. Cas3]|uniref:peptidase n=1 Tax=Frankia sp. Cas3 TaxID=3073926 RepID=UPI002AD3A47C|nr:peptidase [Frankia sp. Cas3]